MVDAFGERPVLKLMYAAIIRARTWRGITVSTSKRRRLEAIREELDQIHHSRQATAEIASLNFEQEPP
jgi:hypothetical protein